MRSNPRRGWYIGFQWKTPYNGRYPRHDYRAWRDFAYWPIRFPSKEIAENHMFKCKDLFMGLHERELRGLTASVNCSRAA